MENFVGCVDAGLATSQGDGRQAVSGHPIGVEAAVADPRLRFQTSRPNGRDGFNNARLGKFEAERFVFEVGAKVDVAGPTAFRAAARDCGGSKSAPIFEAVSSRPHNQNCSHATLQRS